MQSQLKFQKTVLKPHELVLTFISNYKRSKLANIILKKMAEVGKSDLPDIRIYYNIIISKSMWYLYRDR